MKIMLEIRHKIAIKLVLTYFYRKGVKTPAEHNNNDKAKKKGISRF